MEQKIRQDTIFLPKISFIKNWILIGCDYGLEKKRKALLFG